MRYNPKPYRSTVREWNVSSFHSHFEPSIFISMTYKEIILNRILDKKTIVEIQSWWADTHVPDYHLNLDDDETAAAEYISKEKVQRMPPREIADILMERRQPKNTDEILNILSASTGRSRQELSDAIFGVGSPDDMQNFYSPTKNERILLKFKVAFSKEKTKNKSLTSNQKTWTDELKALWADVEKAIPEEAFDEANEEANMYLKRYVKQGFPEWLDDGLAED